MLVKKWISTGTDKNNTSVPGKQKGEHMADCQQECQLVLAGNIRKLENCLCHYNFLKGPPQ